MPELKNRIGIFKMKKLQVAGILLLLSLAAMQLWFNNIHSTQAVSAMVAQVRFYGDYRVGDGPWQPIVEGQHISSTQGDVTLQGNFHILAPDGEYVGIYSGDMPIAFYTNHIGLTFYEKENEPYVIDRENPLYGVSACGVSWNAYLLTSGCEEPIEILIHNPHRFGNKNAIDEMLSNLALWSGIDFESGVLERGQTQRNIGLFFVMVSFILLGSALFSALLRIPNNSIIWLLGATILSAGIYLTYSAFGVFFWSEIYCCQYQCSRFFYDVLYVVHISDYHAFAEGNKKNWLHYYNVLGCHRWCILPIAGVGESVFLRHLATVGHYPEHGKFCSAVLLD